MLEFKKIEINDISVYNKIVKNKADRSCENAFVNLIVWQEIYNNKMAVCDDIIIIKSGENDKETFRIPFGNNLEKGYNLILEYCGNKTPAFWTAQGNLFDKFKNLYGDSYIFESTRDAFDYLYLKDDLANLNGKKYHSKRNHISQFSKTFNWCYKPINDSNIEDIFACAEKWYKENEHRMDRYMLAEKNGVILMLNNMNTLNLTGGAIYINDAPVAFTIGSKICNDTYDIHIEKALSDYSAAYTVINREFAKNLPDEIIYINREDDMGLENLRKAKLSYKPYSLIEKFRCVHK